MQIFRLCFVITGIIINVNIIISLLSLFLFCFYSNFLICIHWHYNCFRSSLCQKRIKRWPNSREMRRFSKVAKMANFGNVSSGLIKPAKSSFLSMFKLKVSHREEALQRLKVQQKDFIEEVRSFSWGLRYCLCFQLHSVLLQIT